MFTTLCSDDSTGHKSGKAFAGIEKRQGKEREGESKE